MFAPLARIRSITLLKARPICLSGRNAAAERISASTSRPSAQARPGSLRSALQGGQLLRILARDPRHEHTEFRQRHRLMNARQFLITNTRSPAHLGRALGDLALRRADNPADRFGHSHLLLVNWPWLCLFSAVVFELYHAAGRPSL
jgi:hypothetical protein